MLRLKLLCGINVQHVAQKWQIGAVTPYFAAVRVGKPTSENSKKELKGVTMTKLEDLSDEVLLLAIELKTMIKDAERATG